MVASIEQLYRKKLNAPVFSRMIYTFINNLHKEEGIICSVISGKKYWITTANSAVRQVISKCVTCRRQRGKTVDQKMADLPKERVLPDEAPFTNVGVDYFGPIDIKRGRSALKRYGVIFTCFSSRAIHLEVTYSLDTDSCINAIRRFICRRGPIKSIRSV